MMYNTEVIISKHPQLKAYLTSEPMQYVKLKKWPTDLTFNPRYSVVDAWNMILSDKAFKQSDINHGKDDGQLVFSKSEEKHYFSVYNYARMKLNELQVLHAQNKSLTDNQLNDMVKFDNMHRSVSNTIAACNMALIDLVMKKRYNGDKSRYDEISDKLQFYLTKAIRNFNPDLGWKFSTYAFDTLAYSINRCSSVNERNLHAYNVSFSSEDGDVISAVDVIAIDLESDPFCKDNILTDELHNTFMHKANLTPVEKQVLMAKFGLPGHYAPDLKSSIDGSMTLTAISDEFILVSENGQRKKLSREQIRRIYHNAVAKLQSVMREDMQMLA